MTITEQEAWQQRGNGARGAHSAYVREVIEELAFQARDRPQGRQALGRQPAAADQLSSRTSSRTPSAAPSRRGENVVVPRVADIYAAMPSITGKFELEYEGELRGAETVAKDLIRAAVLNVSTGYFRDSDARGRSCAGSRPAALCR